MLFLALPLEIVDGLLRTIFNEIAVVVDTRPFRLPIWDIKHSSWVKHVATAVVRYWHWNLAKKESLPDLKVLPLFWGLEVDQGWKQQDHVPPFIHDGCPAICAADLARKFMDAGLLRTFVPTEIMDTVSEVNVVFVEDGCPLKGCTCDEYEWPIKLHGISSD